MYSGREARTILTNCSRSKWAPRCRFIIIYLRCALNHACAGGGMARRRINGTARSGEIAKKATPGTTTRRKSSTAPRITGRLVNLTSVASAFESRREPTESEKRFTCKSEKPLFPFFFPRESFQWTLPISYAITTLFVIGTIRNSVWIFTSIAGTSTLNNKLFYYLIEQTPPRVTPEEAF